MWYNCHELHISPIGLWNPCNALCEAWAASDERNHYLLQGALSSQNALCSQGNSAHNTHTHMQFLTLYTRTSYLQFFFLDSSFTLVILWAKPGFYFWSPLWSLVHLGTLAMGSHISSHHACVFLSWFLDSFYVLLNRMLSLSVPGSGGGGVVWRGQGTVWKSSEFVVSCG